MRTPSSTVSPLALLALLAACESAPRPPDVDESRKRPANSATAVSLQVCKTDLHNTRLAASETLLREEATRAGLDRLKLQNQLLTLATRAPTAAESSPTPPAIVAIDGTNTASAGNRIYTMNFAYGSTRIDLAHPIAQHIVSQAKSAPLVLLRGRTDATQDNLADSRIARERANAVRQYLVAAGVDPARIRSTHQPAGDPVADNSQTAGRASNRRVEIEIYRAAPVRMAAATQAAPASSPVQP